MIYEYAVDPEVASSWGSRAEYRYFIDKFGLGKTRQISRFPKKWQRLVWEAYSGQNDIEKKRLEELLIRTTETSVVRSYSDYDGGKWLDNALRVHSNVPFKAIISKDKTSENKAVFHPNEIDESYPEWNSESTVVVPREAEAMAAAVAPLLSCATEIIFVDPHFAPEKSRYRKTFRAFLCALSNDRRGPVKSIQVHAQAKSTTDFYYQTCRDRLTKLIPDGLCVSFFRWESKDGGQALHNRYILTDLGGLSFQHGLDEGRPGEVDDIAILDRENYVFRWGQYSRASNSFELMDSPFDLIGCK